MVEVILISPAFKGLLREPIGLYYLAGVLNANRISTVLMDFNVALPTLSEFRKYLQNLKPKIIGISSYTFNFSAAQHILKEIKNVDSSIITVFGGVHASSIPDSVLKTTPALDLVVIGEGELTILELFRKILTGESIQTVEGIAFREGGEVIINPSRGLIKDLDELPVPNRDLLPLQKYPIVSVQTSRGCPHNCIFCMINKFYGKKIRLRDPKKVVDECESIVNRFGAKKFFFFGDSFTFNSGWVEEFCDQLCSRKLDIQWGCETRVDDVSLPLLKAMRRAGCIEVQYGIDYGDEKILKSLGKDISLNCVSDAVNWAKKAELFTGGFFIFNVPGENETTMENTFKLIQKVPVDAIEINLLTPYPGTTIWNDPKKYGMRIIEQNFDYYTTKKYVMENINFPKNEFVPAFKTLLKRLNFIQSSEYYPEIYDFLKKNIELKIWKKK